jgi:bis(5'-adenosyl)-triphosphatase
MKDEADMQISSITESKSISSQQLFGRFIISPDQIFYRSIHSFAMVNLRPIVPGHVLICSTRVIPLLSELNDDEYDDLWKSVRFVQRVLKVKYNCDAFNVAVQDGTHAGQSVPHVHVHVLPRHRGDLERNDDIYDELEAWAPRDEKNSMEIPKFDVPEDSERRDRTIQEMAAESAMYKSLLM